MNIGSRALLSLHKYCSLVPIICYVAAVPTRFVDLWDRAESKDRALPLSVLLVVNFFKIGHGTRFLFSQELNTEACMPVSHRSESA